jgi:DNA polymerase-3 subunit gamma/tau
MQSLFQQYRPQTLAEVKGQDQAIRQIQAVAKRGLAGRAFWLVGASGTGKSTLAMILAREVADPFCIEEIDATGINPTDIDRLERVMSCYGGLGSTGKSGRAFVINEAHGLKAGIVRRLLVLLEALPSHVIFIFTTTRDGQGKLFDGSDDTAPLISRCVNLSLRDDPREAFAQRVMEIARAENLDGQPIDCYLALADRCKCNMRAMLQAVEAGTMLEGVCATENAPTGEIKPSEADLFAARARFAAMLAKNSPAAKGGGK